MLTFSKVEECGARLAAILSRSVKVTHCSVVEYLYYLKGSKLNLGFDNTMGGLTSRHVEVMTKEPETQGTPKHTHVLPYDPRSPSDYITRTPITVANTPDKGCEDTPRIFKVLSLDPRSPNTEVTHCSVVEYLYYLKGSKLNLGFDNTMGGLISRHVKVVTKEPDTQGTPKHTRVLPYDPRSPSDYLTRTPITQVANTPDKGCEDTPRIFKVLSLDPHSPNTEECYSRQVGDLSLHFEEIYC
nr:uncharacterized protein LOC128691454 isoform X7 [Cherax quadricarinatus]